MNLEECMITSIVGEDLLTPEYLNASLGQFVLFYLYSLLSCLNQPFKSFLEAFLLSVVDGRRDWAVSWPPIGSSSPLTPWYAWNVFHFFAESKSAGFQVETRQEREGDSGYLSPLNSDRRAEF